MSQFEAMNDNGAATPAERRREGRHRVLLQGKLVYPHNRLSVDCTIRDLSAGGARIQVAPEAISDHPFLIIVRQAVVYESATSWQTHAQAGLRFLNAVDLGGEPPAHLRNIRRIWMELMPR